MKKRAYIYPITARLKTGIHNPYINDFMDALSTDFDFMNRTQPSNKGILDLPAYMNKIDFLFLNWIEDLPDKKGGFIQVIFFSIFIWILKIRKVKIVFTLHNKLSHYHRNIAQKKYVFKRVIQNADYIITHAEAGKEFLGKFNKIQGKIFFKNHPVKKYNVEKREKKPIS